MATLEMQQTKGYQLRATLTEAEYREVKAQAALKGMGIADYVAEALREKQARETQSRGE